MNAKFKLTSETKTWFGRTLFRIEALISFGSVEAGDKGGFVEKEENISPDGNAWVSGNAWVYGDAQVSGDARVYGDARVSGDAQIVKPITTASRSDGYTFALLPHKDGSFRITAGCRYFTFQQAREHWQATRAGTPLGDETFSILDHFDRMAAIPGIAHVAEDAA